MFKNLTDKIRVTNQYLLMVTFLIIIALATVATVTALVQAKRENLKFSDFTDNKTINLDTVSAFSFPKKTKSGSYLVFVVDNVLRKINDDNYIVNQKENEEKGDYELFAKNAVILDSSGKISKRLFDKDVIIKSAHVNGDLIQIFYTNYFRAKNESDIRSKKYSLYLFDSKKIKEKVVEDSVNSVINTTIIGHYIFAEFGMDCEQEREFKKFRQKPSLVNVNVDNLDEVKIFGLE